MIFKLANEAIQRAYKGEPHENIVRINVGRGAGHTEAAIELAALYNSLLLVQTRGMIGEIERRHHSISPISINEFICRSDQMYRGLRKEFKVVIFDSCSQNTINRAIDNCYKLGWCPIFVIFGESY